MSRPDYASWRTQVDKELAGASFDKLVQVTAEGIALQPLYMDPVSANAPLPPPGIGVCMRADASTVQAELDGGADAIWTDSRDEATHQVLDASARAGRHVHWVVDWSAPSSAELVETSPRLASSTFVAGSRADRTATSDPSATPPGHALWHGFDPFAAATATGETDAERLLRDSRILYSAGWPTWMRSVRVSSLPYHNAGADAADELAIAMSTLVAYLRGGDAAGMSVADRARGTWFQIGIGRDTFGEIAKLRALRLLGAKVFTAAGAPDARIDAVHAVCSERTLAQRDPWVNLLRVTTQVFAAAVGGAQLVTPQPFDAALGAPSDLARRAARNTALVLRDESHLGKVVDAAGGSYYLEARTEALAREAWQRFTAMEREGGIVKLLETGAIHERMANAWKPRAAAIAKRKEPVLGVSEFANLDEKLPNQPSAAGTAGTAGAADAFGGAGAGASGLPRHREGAAFEALRTRVEAGTTREVVLFTMGPAAEHRGRVGFAQGLFATAGLRTREVSASELDDSGLSEKLAAVAGPVQVACLCGSDDRYAADAVSLAASLKTAGVKHIVLAGRPGDLEQPLRLAGCEHFIYLGCDVIATIEGVLR